MMFDRHANLKYKFGNRHFWAEGYYVSTVGLNDATVKKYIRDQERAYVFLLYATQIKRFMNSIAGMVSLTRTLSSWRL